MEQEILQPETLLSVYRPFYAELSELKTANAALVFDYTTTEGQKEAKSHIAKLRKSKTAIEAVRKAEKAESLEYGRKVDAQAKSITAEVEEMISLHLEPLLEIERKEAARVQAIKDRVAVLELAAAPQPHLLREQLLENLAKVNDISVDESFEEFQEAAEKLKAQAIMMLEGAIALADKRAAEEAAAAKERAKEQARIQKEREAKIKADTEAKMKAQYEERERQLSQQAEQAKRAQEQAEERAKRAAEAERARIEAEAAQLKADEEKREANKKHRAKIHNEMKASLKNIDGIDDDLAHAIVVAIAQHQIQHTFITY